MHLCLVICFDDCKSSAACASRTFVEGRAARQSDALVVSQA
jgi:hypothetical protein